jgi:multidrug efflux system outer membrane protein
MKPRLSFAARLPLAALLAALAGCAAPGPKPSPKALQEAPLAGTELPAGGQWPAAQWWQRYQDPTLDRLVATALAGSPTLASAHARFDTAREQVRATAAATGAHVDASAQFQRQRLSENGLIPPAFLGFTWYNQVDLGLSASYTFDWWGKQRASVEAATDEAHAAAADHAAAALALSGAVVDSYFGWQSDQARLALLQERIATLAGIEAIAAARQHAELDSGDEQAHAAADIAAARVELAGLQGSAQMRLVALAALCGQSVAQLPPLTARALPVLPPLVPERISLDLLAHRPDIAASRWRVEAAQRRRHVAAAQYYPDITVSGLIGLESIDMNQILDSSNRVPHFGVAIHLPLYDNGLRAAQLGAADTGIVAAVASYNDTIIGAARELAGSVIAGNQAAAERTQQLAQLEATSALQRNADARVREGLTDARPALNAQFAVLVQRDALVQLEAAGLSADSALQRALGGGYSDSTSNDNASPYPP